MGSGQETRGRTDRVAVLTAGRDRPYAIGLGLALLEQGLEVDYVGSDAVDTPELHRYPGFHFCNIRDQRENASAAAKMWRVLSYYCRLMTFAIRTRSRILHLLWNNKFELFDRTVLMVFYRLLGRHLVMTAHNVNAGRRDGTNTRLNFFTLRMQYRLCHHIFVHTRRMRDELIDEFGVAGDRVTVIPFGINNTVPVTGLTVAEARVRLGLQPGERTMLFFGNIAPYKGVEFLVAAMDEAGKAGGSYRLIIAGKPKGCEDYWQRVQEDIRRRGLEGRIIARVEYIPDEEIELYFKAADVLVLPYTHVFQSGVLFLGYSFGLPVIATDVGSLREEILEGETGWLCRPSDASDLARAIVTCFDSDVYRQLDARRGSIRDFANERYSWRKVAEMTRRVYAALPGAVPTGNGAPGAATAARTQSR